MKYHWLLDNGHGGVDDSGNYTTCENYVKNDPTTWYKMHIHSGVPIYEGEFNRRVVDEIATQLWSLGIDYTLINPEVDDISLKERVNRVNSFHKRDKRCILVSVHGNAFNGTAKGFEVFTSKGQTGSDSIADIFAVKMSLMFPKKVMRWDLSDKDKDKEANFYILKNTSCPAILTENFFFDNKEDAALMMSDEGVKQIAQAHVNAIINIEKNGF